MDTDAEINKEMVIWTTSPDAKNKLPIIAASPSIPTMPPGIKNSNMMRTTPIKNSTSASYPVIPATRCP